MYDHDPTKFIIAAEAFYICYRFHTTKGKPPGQLLFGWDIIVPIVRMYFWDITWQNKQAPINKDTKW